MSGYTHQKFHLEGIVGRQTSDWEAMPRPPAPSRVYSSDHLLILLTLSLRSYFTWFFIAQHRISFHFVNVYTCTGVHPYHGCCQWQRGADGIRGWLPVTAADAAAAVLRGLWRHHARIWLDFLRRHKTFTANLIIQTHYVTNVDQFAYVNTEIKTPTASACIVWYSRITGANNKKSRDVADKFFSADRHEVLFADIVNNGVFYCNHFMDFDTELCWNLPCVIDFTYIKVKSTMQVRCLSPFLSLLEP